MIIDQHEGANPPEWLSADVVASVRRDAALILATENNAVGVATALWDLPHWNWNWFDGRKVRAVVLVVLVAAPEVPDQWTCKAYRYRSIHQRQSCEAKARALLARVEAAIQKNGCEPVRAGGQN